MIAERWRYLDSGPMTGVENMALDEAILEAHASGLVPPTLRTYGWQLPAVSIGRFQCPDSAVNRKSCQDLGVELVRRPTGGRAILHTAEEVTFSLVISAERLGTTGVMGAYRRLAGGIIAALRFLGLEAHLVERGDPVSDPQAPVVSRDPACFAVKARCDLVVGDSKLVGSAQVQRRGFLLQQNSLPLRLALEDWPRVFVRPAVAPGAVGLWEAANRRIPYADVAAALRGGYAQSFGVVFEEAAFTDHEWRRAKEQTGQARL